MAERHRAPDRVGQWESFSAAQEGPEEGSRVGLGRWAAAPTAGEVFRSYLLLGFVVLCGLLLVLDAVGPGGDGGALASPFGVAAITAVAAVFLQIFSFVLVLLLAVQAPGGHRRLLWLALFFASTLLATLGRFAAQPLDSYFADLAIAGWSFSLLGYGSDSILPTRIWRRRAGWLNLLGWLLLLLGLTAAAAWESLSEPWIRRGLAVLAVVPMVVFLSGWRRWAGTPEEATAEELSVRRTLQLLLGLDVVFLVDVFGLTRWPWPLRSPFFLPFASCLVLYFVARTYTDALRSIRFYGRFIRPGLKRLLAQKGRDIFSDEKLFRGRRTVIMKIDMASYTKTTFEMPYGMRRLFQDLWFNLIDQVVADKVFLDKSLGDGSVYCFESDLPGGSCAAAFEAALEIRDRQVKLFDVVFRRRLEALLEETPELAERAPDYFEAYQRKTQESFWKRRTQIRIALVIGFVDEGLWGLKSQSHYDVQGPPVVLVTRIEAEARNGEIVFDPAFLEELEKDRPGLIDRADLEERKVDLKGIGPWTVLALPPSAHSSTAIIPPQWRPRVGSPC